MESFYSWSYILLNYFCFLLKLIYFEKAMNVCKISTVDLSYVVTVKSTVEISQNFVVFLQYINFHKLSFLCLQLSIRLFYFIFKVKDVKWKMKKIFMALLWPFVKKLSFRLHETRVVLENIKSLLKNIIFSDSMVSD